MLRLVRRHLVAKLALLLMVMVALGFFVSATISVRNQMRVMEALNRRAAESLARSIVAGVVNSMLSGNGLAVRRIIDEAQSGLTEAGAVKIRVFAPNGEEVFGRPLPPPEPNALPDHIRRALAGAPEDGTKNGLRSLPIPNEERCRQCHENGVLRGVLTIGTEGAKTPIGAGDGGLVALANITREAFIQIMTARKEDGLDDFFTELARRSPGVSNAVVYGADGNPRYGDALAEIDAATLKRALAPGAAFVVHADGKRIVAEPLANEPRCQGCHEKGDTMRGALFVTLDPAGLSSERTLLEVSKVSLQHVMLCGLGRLVNRFLDQAAKTGAMSVLTLHDAEGRLYHDVSITPSPPGPVAESLRTKQPVLQTHEAGERAELVHVAPMANDERCQRCHGIDQPLRGAIEVGIDTSAEMRERQSLGRLSLLFGAATFLLVVVGLYLGLRLTVLEPVAAIGRVADQVGEGRLDVRAPIRSDDEIGRLAERLNQMIVGLKQKLELAKFVSRETLKTVDMGEGTIERMGERRRMTVLFSDVRGFTAFSETRQPEEVVDMLNRYLEVQAEVVVRHGGDIDKFVGDELMARFSGPEMELRAVSCAVELIEAVAKLNERLGAQAYGISIGAGVSTGDMVLGAMGARDRMDFTVIGDAVNLGARLCSHAKPGEVLVSKPVQEAVNAASQLAFEELTPLAVKGKREPVSVYAAMKRI